MKERVRWLCRNDLFFLLVYVLRRPDADSDFVFDRCREVQAEPDNCIDLWFRGGYKSTVITFALTIQDILKDPELTFGIFSFSRPIAKQFLRQIKQEFEQNTFLNWLFDDILWGGKAPPGVKWSEDDGIIVRRKSNPKESTVEAWGLVDGMPTSKHFRRMVYDDVVTDGSVTTSEQIKRTTRAWGLSRALVAKESRTRIIGTRYHYFDTYADVMKRGFRVRKYAATKDGREDGDPWLHTPEQLASKRLEMQESFAPQMMQEPRLAADAYFRPDWWRRHYGPPIYANVYIGCDFAVTKQGGDYTVFSVVAIDADDNMHLIDVWRERTDPSVWMEELIGLIEHYQPMAVGVPIDQIQKSVGPFLRKRMLERRVYANIVELPEAGSDKVAKARSFQGRAAMGKVYLPSPTLPDAVSNGIAYDVPAWLGDVEVELDMFPMGQHDDVVDSLSVIGRLLDLIVSGHVPSAPKKADPDPDYGTGLGDAYDQELDPMLV